MDSAQTALNDSERRLRAVLDNASVAIFLTDDRQHCVFLNHAAEELTGYSQDEVLRRNEPLHNIIHFRRPDGAPYPIEECPIDRSFPEHHRVTGQEFFVHKNGDSIPVAFTASPVDDGGKPVGTIIEARSLVAERAVEAERAAARRQLQDTEHLLVSIGESSADLIYAKDRQGRLLYANPATLAVIGRSAADVIGKNEVEWHDNPDEAANIMAIDQGVMSRGQVERIDEVFTTHGGQRRIYRSTKAPMRDGDGTVVGLVGITSDVTDRRLAEEHNATLLHELRHRVKNTLATVQSLAFQTFAASAPRDYDAFEGRLVALARAHDTLTAGLRQVAGLRDVIVSAVEPFRFDGRVGLTGNDCQVPPNAALTLAMIIHELGTNACKYGALSGPNGRVDLRWSCAETVDARSIRVTWQETGGPLVRQPKRRGFGSRLIERQVAREFGGTSELDFQPDGVRAEIRLNLPKGADPTPP